jgi:probable O-glycosylation ligase (exosortase A-associated)
MPDGRSGLFTILTGGNHMVMGPGESTYIGGNNNFGLALAMIMPMLLVYAREQKQLWARNALWGAFWLSGIASVFTYSRGALLGLAAVFLMLFPSVKRKALVLAFVIPALLIALPFVPEALINRAGTIETYQTDNSAMGRIQAWGVALNIAASHPLGAGFGLDFVSPSTWLSYASFFQSARVISRIASIFRCCEHGFVGLFCSLPAGFDLACVRPRQEARRASEPLN